MTRSQIPDEGSAPFVYAPGARDTEYIRRELEGEPEHIHKCVIPVEWKEVSNFKRYDYDHLVEHKDAHTTVIKLRCECGEEITR